MHLTKSNALVKKNNSNDDDDDNDKNENVSTNDDETTLLLELTPFSQAFATVMEAFRTCLLYTSPSPRDGLLSRMPSSA